MGQTMIMAGVLDLIKRSLWGDGSGSADWQIFEEMKKHAISALPAGILSKLEMPEDLRQAWQREVYLQITYNTNYRAFQAALPVTVPYVILKGTAAAKYYPQPVLRVMGDIDIMPRREDFDMAYQVFLDQGYEIKKNYDRETGFVKDGIMVELHRSFAKLNDPAHAKYLDELIIANINPSHELPDDVNGLVLLEHISQHLAFGLGLRQIIDWMMFVNQCLPDEKWPAFRPMAMNIGLEKLAVVTTRMCEIYLGLPQRVWCAGADETICRQLMDYVLSCGNFGSERLTDRGTSENAFIYARNPAAAFRLLQKRGLVNWKAAKRFPFLRPFAWIYQAGRYLKRGLSQRDAVDELKAAYAESKKRRAMFDMLGVRQDSKGLVVYKNGRYIKERRNLLHWTNQRG